MRKGKPGWICILLAMVAGGVTLRWTFRDFSTDSPPSRSTRLFIQPTFQGSKLRADEAGGPLTFTYLRQSASSRTHTPVAPRTAADAGARATYGRLPLQFERNEGQTEKRVRFLSRGRGYTVFLTKNAEVVLVLSNGDHRVRQKDANNPKTRLRSPKSALRNPTSAVVRTKLVNANPNPHISGCDEHPGKVNYFIGNDPNKWRSNVPTYAKVKYESVYSGIDLVYYGNQEGRLEHDFIVSPGADPKQIAFQINNSFCYPHSKLRMDEDGDLVIHTLGGSIEFHKPVAYQDTPEGRMEIPVRYALLETTGHQPLTTFVLGKYDKSLPLIIDPVLSYSTYLGGSASDKSWSIAVDGAGNAYIAGYTESTNFPTANAPRELTEGMGMLS